MGGLIILAELLRDDSAALQDTSITVKIIK